MAKSNGSDGGDDTATVEGRDAPVIDLNDASLKKLIARGKKRGYLTYDELNEALPQDQMSSDQLEDIMSALNEMGVNIVENEEVGEDGDEPARADDDDDEPAADAADADAAKDAAKDGAATADVDWFKELGLAKDGGRE